MNFQKGKWWYETLINRKPDFVTHVGLAELSNHPWRLQLAEGTVEKKSGLFRFGVKSIGEEKETFHSNELNISDVQVYSCEESAG